jgi:hypothetical protein
MEGRLGLGGRLGVKVLRAKGPGLWWWLLNWLRWSKLRSLVGVFVVQPLAQFFGLMTAYGKLSAVLIRANGERVNFGVLDYRVITTAFVNFMVDQLQTETSVWGDFKYHDSGVGTTDPAVGDTDIETTDGESRATGTQTEGASANIYRSVGTIAYTTSKAITEHGLFNASTGVTLMDRSEFAAINVVNGDSIQFTYELTATAGG